LLIRDKTNPPTIARQLETEAMRPIIKLVIGVVCPPIPRLRIPDFCNKKNNTRKPSPIGRAFQITSSLCFSLTVLSTERK
jgi:hypothetical protein